MVPASAKVFYGTSVDALKFGIDLGCAAPARLGLLAPKLWRTVGAPRRSSSSRVGMGRCVSSHPTKRTPPQEAGKVGRHFFPMNGLHSATVVALEISTKTFSQHFIQSYATSYRSARMWPSACRGLGHIGVSRPKHTISSKRFRRENQQESNGARV